MKAGDKITFDNKRFMVLKVNKKTAILREILKEEIKNSKYRISFGDKYTADLIAEKK